MCMKERTAGKRKAVLAALGVAGLVALSGVQSTPVSAGTDELGMNVPLITINTVDANPMDTLKTELIETRCAVDPSVRAEDINVDASRIDASGFDRLKAGLQTVNARVYINDDSQTESLSYSFTEKATVLVKETAEPVIRLKAKSITVNNGDAWNPFSAVSYLNDDSGILPAVKVKGKVNMNEDGDYRVRYTAVDMEGNTSAVSLTVKVRTPEEVIKAREEEERIAREKAEAEEAARLEEERRQQEEEERTRLETLAAAMNYSAAGGSATGNAIAQAARAWAGVGYYVWGGADPATGADCSGFTQYIYSLFGINLAHNNIAQMAAGYQVSAADARPGDLVVWESHVGIYTGNGYYVSAMSSELGILEIPISASRGSGAYYGIYRISGVN